MSELKLRQVQFIEYREVFDDNSDIFDLCFPDNDPPLVMSIEALASRLACARTECNGCNAAHQARIAELERVLNKLCYGDIQVLVGSMMGEGMY